MELLERRKIQHDGVHCRFDLEQLSPRAMVLNISGTDVGEFGEAPMLTLSEWLAGTTTPVEFFIDARDVRGASIDVSGEWAQWLGNHKGRLRKITMLKDRVSYTSPLSLCRALRIWKARCGLAPNLTFSIAR
jgi:hypothetical protein